MSLGAEQTTNSPRDRKRSDPYGILGDSIPSPKTINTLMAFEAHVHTERALRIDTSIGRLGMTLCSGVTTSGLLVAVRCIRLDSTDTAHVFSRGNVQTGVNPQQWNWEQVLRVEPVEQGIEFTLPPEDIDGDPAYLNVLYDRSNYEPDESHRMSVRSIAEVLGRFRYESERPELYKHESSSSVHPLAGVEMPPKRNILIDKTN